MKNKTVSKDFAMQHCVDVIEQIRRADYKGDRKTLQILGRKLVSVSTDQAITARILYWRGFAFWRSAINGFNDSTIPAEIESDIQSAIAEFDAAIQEDDMFLDAKISAAACRGLLVYLNHVGMSSQKDLLMQAQQLLKMVKDVSPDHPRLLWVMGPIYWNAPLDRGGGADVCIEMYKRGLEIIRTMEVTSRNDLEPTWGEAELLMSLAWSYLNHPTSNLESAELYAKTALDIVPYWHYVRDILLPQIYEAKNKFSSTSS
ncbi:MAG TPA: hypothetical protein PLQ75_02665 [Anaerolineales bacterium]|nr:hypothetical protein [Anaerolineales bacterium]